MSITHIWDCQYPIIYGNVNNPYMRMSISHIWECQCPIYGNVNKAVEIKPYAKK